MNTIAQQIYFAAHDAQHAISLADERDFTCEVEEGLTYITFSDMSSLIFDGKSVEAD